MLAFLHENGFNWDSNPTTEAAANGYMNCSTYAHMHGCPWCGTCIHAAASCHLDCLTYAHQRGATGNRTTSTQAAVFKQYDSLKYCVENKCPVS